MQGTPPGCQTNFFIFMQFSAKKNWLAHRLREFVPPATPHRPQENPASATAKSKFCMRSFSLQRYSQSHRVLSYRPFTKTTGWNTPQRWFLPAAPIDSQWTLLCSTGIVPVEIMERLGTMRQAVGGGIWSVSSKLTLHTVSSLILPPMALPL